MKQVHPFQQRVLDYILLQQLIAAKYSILAAVSGGPDSVALLHVLVSLRDILDIGQITVLHFDHQLRRDASAADRVFVKALADTYSLPFHAGSGDVRCHQQSQRISLEMAARVCRHRFFREALNQLEANAVALGHTANDQAEEILLRLFRGAGPSGMSGMRPKTVGGLIRPLLFATRNEILSYLHDQKLSFREDLSNRDTAHQRNAVRHKIFPVLENHFHPKVVDVLCRHARLAEDEESCWNELMADHWQTLCVEETPSRIVVGVQGLLSLHPAFRRRLLRLALERLRGNLQGIYAVHIESLCRLLVSSVPGKLTQLPGGLWAMLEGEFLELSRESRWTGPASVQDYMLTMSGPGRYRFPTFELHISLRDAQSSTDTSSFPEHPYASWFDAGEIKWPLSLRFWKRGDRFCPLGLRGSKKLQDFFVDCKIPQRERNRILLLCDQEKICWVVGHRLDDRVKVTPQTKEILIIEKSSSQHSGHRTHSSM